MRRRKKSVNFAREINNSKNHVKTSFYYLLCSLGASSVRQPKDHRLPAIAEANVVSELTLSEYFINLNPQNFWAINIITKYITGAKEFESIEELVEYSEGYKNVILHSEITELEKEEILHTIYYFEECGTLWVKAQSGDESE